MNDGLNVAQEFLRQLFLDARTHSKWSDKNVSNELLQQIYDLARMGPTSANCQPLRILFIRSEDAKQRLRESLNPGNVEKTMAAPVTAIFAMDMEFYQHMPSLFHDPTAKDWFAGKPEMIADTAMRNATLQAGYFILAARALGLDCGPMSGFNKAKLDAEFFANTSWRSNFLCNLGHGIEEALHPRNRRFDFSETCKIL